MFEFNSRFSQSKLKFSTNRSVPWKMIPYPRVNCLKTIPFTAAHTYIAHIRCYPHPPPLRARTSLCWASASTQYHYSQLLMVFISIRYRRKLYNKCCSNVCNWLVPPLYKVCAFSFQLAHNCQQLQSHFSQKFSTTVARQFKSTSRASQRKNVAKAEQKTASLSTKTE